MVGKSDGQPKMNPKGTWQTKSELQKEDDCGNWRNCFHQNERKQESLDISTLKYGPMNNFMGVQKSFVKKDITGALRPRETDQAR